MVLSGVAGPSSPKSDAGNKLEQPVKDEYQEESAVETVVDIPNDEGEVLRIRWQRFW